MAGFLFPLLQVTKADFVIQQKPFCTGNGLVILDYPDRLHAAQPVKFTTQYTEMLADLHEAMEREATERWLVELGQPPVETKKVRFGALYGSGPNFQQIVKRRTP